MAPAQPFPAARGKSSAYRELHQLDGVEILHVAADMEFLRRDGRRPCPRILISRGPSSDIWRRVSGDHRVQFGVRPIKHSSLSAVVALALLFAAPLFAGEQGITRKETVEIMLADALPAKIDKDGRGNVIVRSRVSDINFDVYFLACTGNPCGAIQSPPAGRTATRAKPGSTSGTPPSAAGECIPSPAR